MPKLTPKQEQKLLRLGKVLDGGAVAVLSELEVAESKIETLEAKLEDVAGQLPELREAEDGRDGYTPIKGKDYFDGKDGYTPVKGVDYFDGERGADGRDGKDSTVPGPKGDIGPIGPPGTPGRDGKDGFVDVATIAYLEDEIKKIEKKTGGYGQVVRELVAGTNVTIDNTNLEYPVINATGGGGGHTIEDEGTPLTQRDTINFTGSGVAVTDVGGKTVVTIGGGGSTAWGDITGTLSAQTDLQTALNGKANSLGVDDNYVTDAEKTKLANLSGTNTGDQDLSGYSLTSHNHTGVYEPADATILKDADIGVTVAAALGANDNYVTDAEKTVIGNTSGTNSGDNAANTTYASDYRAANFVAGTNYVAPNVAITGATKTKVTYDTKGLVTSGADATTADIADSLNKRYVTDANLTTIGNQSGTNTGDQTIKDTFGITVDGAGTALTTGTKGYRYIEQNCTITGWHVRSDISGSVVFDVKRSGVSIAGSEKPTLSATTSNSDLALSTWTTSLVAGDIIEFVIDSASTLTRATLTVLITKT